MIMRTPDSITHSYIDKPQHYITSDNEVLAVRYLGRDSSRVAVHRRMVDAVGGGLRCVVCSAAGSGEGICIDRWRYLLMGCIYVCFIDQACWIYVLEIKMKRM